MNVQYGVSVIRPEMLVSIVTPPPPSQVDRLLVKAMSIWQGFVIIAIALMVLGAGTMFLAFIKAVPLAPLFGIAVGMVTFMVWEDRRG